MTAADPHAPRPPVARGALATLTALAAFAPLTAVAAVAPATAAAQQDSLPAAPAPPPADTFELEEVVVTATRVPLHRDALPTPVTVLTGEALRSQGIRTVGEALRGVPGAAVVRAGSHGAQTSLFMRGGESDYVKVLVDGVPVNEPGGAIDFADLSTDQVERIEVVRGPVSVLYGTDAVSGVIQIFTRRGHGSPTLAVTATGGLGDRHRAEDGYGALDAEATLSGSAGPVGYTIGAGRFWTEGSYPFNNQRALNTGTGRLDWSPRPGTELALTTRYAASESHFPTDGAGNLVDANAYLDRRLWTASFEAGHRLTDRLNARLQVGIASRDQLTTDQPDDEADRSGVYASELGLEVDRRAVDARITADLPRTLATAGVSLDWSDAATAYTSESEWGPTEVAASYDRLNRGYYVQVLTNPVDPVDLTLGGRIDDSDAFGTFRTYRLGASFRLPWGARLRAAIGRGFREPTFSESFGSGFGDVGNDGLVPERSLSREIGLEQDIGQAVRLGATWFDQRFDDLIQYTSSPPTAGGPNYFNVGAARAAGVEVTGEADAGPVVVSAGYTWLETEVLDPGLATDASFVEGEALLRRPAHSGSLAARYRLPAGTLGATVHLAGERWDVDYGAGFPAPRVALPAYATVDVSAEHALPIRTGPAVRAILRVENLTNAAYEPVSGFPAPGRLVHVGVRILAGGS